MYIYIYAVLLIFIFGKQKGHADGRARRHVVNAEVTHDHPDPRHDVDHDHARRLGAAEDDHSLVRGRPVVLAVAVAVATEDGS